MADFLRYSVYSKNYRYSHFKYLQVWKFIGHTYIHINADISINFINPVASQLSQPIKNICEHFNVYTINDQRHLYITS